MSDIIVLGGRLVLITAVVQRGAADAVVQAAQEAGAQGATIFHAHGTGVRQKRWGAPGLTVNATRKSSISWCPRTRPTRCSNASSSAPRWTRRAWGILWMTPLE